MPIEFPMFTIICMQFVVMLCFQCDPEVKQQPLATTCSYSFEDEEVYFNYCNKHWIKLLDS